MSRDGSTPMFTGPAELRMLRMILVDSSPVPDSGR
jgi:hypothetical protein